MRARDFFPTEHADGVFADSVSAVRAGADRLLTPIIVLREDELAALRAGQLVLISTDAGDVLIAAAPDASDAA